MMIRGRGDDRAPARGRLTRRTLVAAAAAGATAAAVGRLWRGGAALGAAALSRDTAVMAPSYVIRSLDPGHTLEPLGEMICHAAYDALVTLNGEDLSSPRPHVATSWTVTGGGRLYTFTLRRDIRFASGNPLTSADVKWSFERVVNLKSNPAFFLDNVAAVTAPDPYTVVLRLRDPQPSIIPILSNGALGIVDSKAAAAQGADAGPDASSRDHAEGYLNSHSLGSGAYILESHTPNQEVVLVRNPRHWRGAPSIARVVIKNIPEASTQALGLERGDLDIATGLGLANAQTLARVPSVTVKSSLIAASFVMMVNMDPELSGSLANPKIIQAIRYGLDYDGILKIAGPGAVRMAGVIPNDLAGALNPREAVKTDRDRAKALVRESGVASPHGRMNYASDQTSFGIQYPILAQKLQADLAAVGITVDLNGLPGAVALGEYRAAKAPALFGGYVADYPDATDFLVYLPGRLVGKRLRWPATASAAAGELAHWGDQAEQEPDARARVALLQKVQRRLLEIGPYIPLFTPALPWGYRADLRGVTFNSVWGTDFFAVRRT
ncbi:MAG TPA: ABC transporter substrate-binding protein [bacterium]|nr:ABC transporter substrate-binding protein [bacterium]